MGNEASAAAGRAFVYQRDALIVAGETHDRFRARCVLWREAAAPDAAWIVHPDLRCVAKARGVDPFAFAAAVTAFADAAARGAADAAPEPALAPLDVYSVVVAVDLYAGAPEIRCFFCLGGAACVLPDVFRGRSADESALFDRLVDEEPWPDASGFDGAFLVDTTNEATRTGFEIGTYTDDRGGVRPSAMRVPLRAGGADVAADDAAELRRIRERLGHGHANVVEVLDVLTDDAGYRFCIVPWCAGGTLDTAGRYLTCAQQMRVLAGACEGLRWLNAVRGVLHTDRCFAFAPRPHTTETPAPTSDPAGCGSIWDPAAPCAASSPARSTSGGPSPTSARPTSAGTTGSTCGPTATSAATWPPSSGAWSPGPPPARAAGRRPDAVTQGRSYGLRWADLMENGADGPRNQLTRLTATVSHVHGFRKVLPNIQGVLTQLTAAAGVVNARLTPEAAPTYDDLYRAAVDDLHLPCHATEIDRSRELVRAIRIPDVPADPPWRRRKRALPVPDPSSDGAA